MQESRHVKKLHIMYFLQVMKSLASKSRPMEKERGAVGGSIGAVGESIGCRTRDQQTAVSLSRTHKD